MEQQPEVAPLTPESASLPAALVAGGVAAVLGAMAWALITVWTSWQIGWMAVGVGFLVGYAVRIFGKGSDATFQVLGAVLSLLGCLAGNLLAVCAMLSEQEQIPFFRILTQLGPAQIVGLMVATFSAMDLLFYGIAIYEGYTVSRSPTATGAISETSVPR